MGIVAGVCLGKAAKLIPHMSLGLLLRPELNMSLIQKECMGG